MDNFSLILSLLSAMGLSGLIGLEREMHIQKHNNERNVLGGLRTYSMMGLLGFLAQYFLNVTGGIWITFLVFFAAISFPLISHFTLAWKEKRLGITSELSLVASFLVGILIGMDNLLLALMVSILFTGLLALKSFLHSIARHISTSELIAILEFLILSFIVLQILPSSWEDPFGFFDWRPKIVWLMVVLVAGIRFIGYFLSKIFGGENTLLLSGIVGGFLSSTAVTTGVAQESKSSPKTVFFLVPILLASGIMFFRVIVEIIVISQNSAHLFAKVLFPLFIMGVLTIAIGIFFFLREKKKKTIKNSPSPKQPLNLISAISFGAFFLIILILSEKISVLFPHSGWGLFLTGAIAGLADVDAITLAMTNLAKTGEISSALAAEVIFIAVVSNTFVKMGIVLLFGSYHLFKSLVVALGCVLFVGGVTLLMI
jgi:uncharacterized membrane protein (DUF4010 family)